MAMDFSVILAVRQRFGDDQADYSDVTGREMQFEEQALFVGQSKDFSFACPNVVPNERAVLQFQSLGVTTRGILKINGVDIPGGLTRGPHLHVFGEVVFSSTTTVPKFTLATWNTHSLLVPANVLREENILHIESVTNSSESLDNFVIDNVVIFFKTKSAGGAVLST